MSGIVWDDSFKRVNDCEANVSRPPLVLHCVLWGRPRMTRQSWGWTGKEDVWASLSVQQRIGMWWYVRAFFNTFTPGGSHGCQQYWKQTLKQKPVVVQGVAQFTPSDLCGFLGQTFIKLTTSSCYIQTKMGARNRNKVSELFTNSLMCSINRKKLTLSF